MRENERKMSEIMRKTKLFRLLHNFSTIINLTFDKIVEKRFNLIRVNAAIILHTNFEQKINNKKYFLLKKDRNRFEEAFFFRICN